MNNSPLYRATNGETVTPMRGGYATVTHPDWTYELLISMDRTEIIPLRPKSPEHGRSKPGQR